MMKIFFGWIVGSLVIALLAFVEALVFTPLWNWFVVPIGGPKINVLQGAGLVLILMMAAGDVNKLTSADDYEEVVFETTVKLLVLFGAGAVLALIQASI